VNFSCNLVPIIKNKCISDLKFVFLLYDVIKCDFFFHSIVSNCVKIPNHPSSLNMRAYNFHVVLCSIFMQFILCLKRNFIFQIILFNM